MVSAARSSSLLSFEQHRALNSNHFVTILNVKSKNPETYNNLYCVIIIIIIIILFNTANCQTAVTVTIWHMSMNIIVVDDLRPTVSISHDTTMLTRMTIRYQ